jgi:uncharacterized RDD family membrane protein YckC
MTYYIANKGKQSGPFSKVQVTEMISSGLISPHDLCWREGLPNWISISQEILSSKTSPLNNQNPSENLRLASFGTRWCAAIIDGIIMYISCYIIGFILGFTLVANGVRDMNLISFLGFTTGVICEWLYHAIMLSSSYQATLGKRAMGILVIDQNGSPITFAQATGRHFGKILSFLTLFIGFLMAGWTKRKQALHDIMANTLVCYK